MQGARRTLGRTQRTLEKAPDSTVIQPRLRVFDLTVITASLIIGLGIFRVPVELAGKAQLPSIYFLAWILGAITSLFGALSFAEIGSRFPATGGFYKLFSYCYHPVLSFMINWISLFANAGTAALVAVIGADYINPLLFPDLDRDIAVRITTIGSVVFLFVVNWAGIRMSSRVLNGLMMVKVGMLLLLISIMFIAPGHPVEAPLPQLSTGQAIQAFALCFSPIFFSCGGYQMVINFGSDIANPKRNMPRSILLGGIISFTLYLLVNISYVQVMGFEGLKHTTSLAVDMVHGLLGDAGAKFVAVVLFLAVLAYVNSSIMANPRVFYAMAEDGVMPPIFKRVNNKTQVQEWALVLYVGTILLTLFMLSSVQKILAFVMFFDSISLSLAVAAVFILRRRAKREGEPADIYKMKWYPFMPLFYVIVYVAVNVSIMWEDPGNALVGFILFLLGWPLYHIVRRSVRNAGGATK